MDSIRVAKVDNVTLERFEQPKRADGTPSRVRQTGTVHLTPHHLIFSPSSSDPSSSASGGSSAAELWVSYPAITLFTRLPQTIQGLYPLQIRTRTFDSFVLYFEKDRDGGAEDVWQSVKDCAVATSVEQLYAFVYQLPSAQHAPKQRVPSGTSNPLSVGESPLDGPSAIMPLPQSPGEEATGWMTFNPRTEFARQGMGSRTKAWRFTDINKDYSFCATYPAKMAVPSRISDSTLAYACKYRSKGRIPALTYLHWANHASITRSSQPMVGLKNARSAQDERLIECIFSSHQSPDTAYASTSAPPPQTANVYGATATNLIVDARPTTNAMANVALGAGTENMENYRSGKKAYLGIDNIHVMRSSLKMIADAIKEAEEVPSIPLDRGLLRKSNWLKHISTLLDGSLIIVKNIHLNASHVLIHCSDGWDRTSQLSAVAQICLDPFYRTLDGFKVLVEKDWLAFGHKFLDRSGHLSSEKLFTVTDAADEDSDEEGGGGASKAAQAFLAWGQKQFTSDHHLKETSPVFHQFLDCVWQIQRQYPDRFEFNEDYLLDLYEHLYSCRFGTFLFNSENQRRTAQTGKPYVERTVSAWDWFDLPEQRKRYVNPAFDPKLDDREARTADTDQGVLLYDPKDVKFWFRLFKRGDEEMNGKLGYNPGSGAEVVTVFPGQVDPVSVEGAMEAAAKVAAGGEPLGVAGPGSAQQRSASSVPPSPSGRAVASSDGSADKDTFRPFNSTNSAYSLHATKPASRPGIGGLFDAPGSSGTGGGGWGKWSQFSSSAFGALSGAASKLNSIGQDALSQIRAEAAEGEAWTRGNDNDTSRTPKATAPVGSGFPSTSSRRIPSEANPWSIPVSATNTAINAPIAASTSSVAARAPARREPSWNANPWGEPAPKPVAAPAQREDLPVPIPPTDSLATLSLKQKPSKDEEADLQAALGGDSKAWDPLGAS